MPHLDIMFQRPKEGSKRSLAPMTPTMEYERGQAEILLAGEGGELGYAISYREPFGDRRVHVIASLKGDGELYEPRNPVALSVVKPKTRGFQLAIQFKCECAKCRKESFCEIFTGDRHRDFAYCIERESRRLERLAVEAECYHVHRRELVKRFKELLKEEGVER